MPTWSEVMRAPLRPSRILECGRGWAKMCPSFMWGTVVVAALFLVRGPVGCNQIIIIITTMLAIVIVQ